MCEAEEGGSERGAPHTSGEKVTALRVSILSLKDSRLSRPAAAAAAPAGAPTAAPAAAAPTAS